MHTPIEFYIKVPVDLFRRGGTSKPRFDYIRTSPPREAPQKFDLKVKEIYGKTVIDHKSGGLSLFNKPDFRSGEDWWMIPKNTPLPPGFTVSKDLTGNVFTGHYSIRAMSDIELAKWRNDLGVWAENNAIHVNKFTGVAEKNNV
jgi:hypothetical protein